MLASRRRGPPQTFDQPMKSAYLTLAFTLSVTVAFFGGRYYQHHQLLVANRFITTKALTLHSNTDSPPGVLPKGVTLYDFGGPDEFPHFLLIVGTKSLNTLQHVTSNDGISRIPVEAAEE